MKESRKGLLMAALICGTIVPVLFGGTSVYAAEAEEDALSSFTLDPMVVTAQRVETRDLDTPATTTTITSEDIRRKGFISVFEALNQTIGITSYSYVSGEGDNGSSTGRTYIRGLDKGTLILVNGAPINLNNYNSTAGVPISAVERIEIVKGSNSVLYGSEAMGGVVNIITKKPGKIENSLKITGGNYKKAYEVTSQGKNYIFNFSRDYFDNFEHSQNENWPKTKYNTMKPKNNRNSLFASINFAKDFTLNYLHTDVKGTGMYYLNPDRTINKTSYKYDDKRDNIALLYENKEQEVKANLAYNRRRIDGTSISTKGKHSRSGASSNIILSSINFDANKVWHTSEKNTLLTGFTANKEKYEEIVNRSHSIERDSLGIYLSYDHKFTDRFSTILGVRGHFVRDDGFDGSHNVYLPQVQTLYKLNDNTSWYINVGKSFEMPAINSKYSRSGTAAFKALKPQEGWTYETGIKKVTDTTSTKLAVFNMKMDNKFKWDTYANQGITPPPGIDASTKIQVNVGEFKNTGVELEYVKNLSDKFQYNLGFTYQNPKSKDDGADWVQESARVQFTAGARYDIGKFNTGMNLFFCGDRENSAYNPPIHRIKNAVKINAMASYAPDKNSRLTLNLYNLLDRKDMINVNEHYEKPFNWTLSYEYRF